jgi:hypothetical protein
MSAEEIAPELTIPPLRLLDHLAPIIAASDGGRARLVDQSASRYLWFEGGNIVSVTSNRDDERLGAWLGGRRLVAPEAVREALADRSPDERLGAALVRRGALPEAVLRRELAALSLTLLARMTIAGGTLGVDPAERLPADARTLDAPPRAALLAAVRASADVDRIADGMGPDDGWTAAEVASGGGTDLTENERYVLSVLKRPRSLDALRRAALIDFTEVLRAVAALSVAGLAVPCECRAALPPARPLAEALSLDAPAPAPDRGESPPAAPAPSSAGAPAKRDVRAMLDALDEAEASAAPMLDIDGRIASTAQRHRVATMIESVGEMMAAGEERRAVKLLLTRALSVFPALTALLKLTELELGEPSTRQLALDRLQRILAKNPRYTDAWLLLAHYWETRSAPEKARGCAAKILAYDPENADARRLLAPPAPAA